MNQFCSRNNSFVWMTLVVFLGTMWIAQTSAHRLPMTLAFVPNGSRIQTRRSASLVLSYQHTTNEWGIPDSTSLPPLSSSPKPSKQLPNGAKVTLVGSGPGDPELLTIAAYRLLTDPEVFVIADRLVSQEILDLIPGEVKVARKLPGCAELAQEEIFWWAHQGLAAGKHVVRLKIGDPFVFGRGGEEVLKFRRYGVEPSVIPVRLIMSKSESSLSLLCG